ncbi:CBM96 family carbohydrate-binding protein [Dyadobacter sandarakinus]|uniref:Malectin n=1 Tax=Dyadobacter sandarakinus TaxID=2747268 RepID=A0ABX7I461_9BACT|nr:DNRLRE domain-containing protein [Dyadobacter sandarakinus]QRR00889.1 malectin [Dyadobacter sandarakinus]
MKQFLLRFQILTLCLGLSASLLAQPAIQWDKTIGGNSEDRLNSVQQTLDGGYILGGTSFSGVSGEKSDSARGLGDYWIVKLAADGTKQWDRTLGGTGREVFSSVRQAKDGSYFVAGSSSSGISGDKTDAIHGEYSDLWILNLSANGTINWQKTIGTTNHEFLNDMEVTPDGGLAIAGGSSPITPLGSGYNHGWFVKLSASGELQWSRDYYVNFNFMQLAAVTLVPGGGYLLGADTSGGEDVGGAYYLIRVSAEGTTLWTKEIRGVNGGNNGNSALRSILATPDGGFLVGGLSRDQAGNDKSEDSYYGDYWVVKITADGVIEWDKTIQANDFERFEGMQLSSDGGYFLWGDTQSVVDLDKTDANSGVVNGWLVKLDANGNQIWDKVIGSASDILYDSATDLVPTNDGGFLLAGFSDAPVGADKTQPSRGANDFWIIKLAPEFQSVPQTTLRINAGGPGFTTATKKRFIADKYYAGTDRTSSIASGDILGTTNDVLYRSARSAPSFSYNIPVGSGQVNVTLHFAETYFGVPGTKGENKGTGSRRFHVNMEGSRKLTNYDIFSAAGGAMRANQITFPVTVTDGVLNIDFLTGAADQPRVCAIEVVASSVTLGPVADAFVRDGSYSATNYGTSPTLDIKYLAGGLSVRRASYLKFQLPAQTAVTSAKLRIYGHNHENTKSISVHAYGIDNDSWTESTINKDNAPAASTASLGFAAVNDVYKYYEIDVTSYVKAQQQAGESLVSLLLNDPNNRNTRVFFNSKEAGSNPPQLVIQTTNSGARLGQEEVLAEVREQQPSTVFPNPVKDQFTGSLSPEHVGVITFEMINAAGKG